jgi:uncharacterized protein DUF4124
MRYVATFLACWLTVGLVWAETCKYVDKDGRVTYSNVPVDNARKLTCIQAPAPLSSDQATELGKQPSSAGQDAAKRQLDVTTERKGTDERRRILDQELTREQDALVKARNSLSEQEAMRFGDERNYARVLERLKPFQDAVATHEKKIDSIKQELTNLK